ncbi:FHA domain-containing protein [Candidatus Woesearchaeota archaeon]|nr:FHA domain-containing protein [Candidatus Woesearchaeota archaeon]
MVVDSRDGTLEDGTLEHVIDAVISGHSEQGYPGYEVDIAKELDAPRYAYSGKNQDAFRAFFIRDGEGRIKYNIGMVADGVSHGGFGEIAANLAIGIVSEYLANKLSDTSKGTEPIAVDASKAQLEQYIREAMDVANEVIRKVREDLLTNKTITAQNETLDILLDARKSYFEASQDIVRTIVGSVKTEVVKSRIVELGKDKEFTLSKDITVKGKTYFKAGDKVINPEDKRLSTGFDVVVERYDHEKGEVDTVIGHTGDTRTYLCTKDVAGTTDVRQLTTDITFGTYCNDSRLAKDKGVVISGLGHHDDLLKPYAWETHDGKPVIVKSDDRREDVPVRFTHPKYEVGSRTDKLVIDLERLVVVCSDGVYNKNKASLNADGTFKIPFLEKEVISDGTESNPSPRERAASIATEIVEAKRAERTVKPITPEHGKGELKGKYYLDDTTAVVIRSRLHPAETIHSHTGSDATPPKGTPAFDDRTVIGYSLRVVEPTTGNTLRNLEGAEIKGFYTLDDLTKRGVEKAVFIGRKEDKCHIVIPDQRISGVHAKIYADRATGKVFLEDAGSKNGTFLETDLEHKLTQPVEVSKATTFVLSYFVKDGTAEKACKLEVTPVYEDEIQVVGYRVIVTNSDTGVVVREAKYSVNLMHSGIRIGNKEFRDICLEQLVAEDHGFLQVSGSGCSVIFRIEGNAETYRVNDDLQPVRDKKLSGRQNLQLGQYLNLEGRFNVRVVPEYGIPEHEIEVELEVVEEGASETPPVLPNATQPQRRQLGDIAGLEEPRQVLIAGPVVDLRTDDDRRSRRVEGGADGVYLASDVIEDLSRTRTDIRLADAQQKKTPDPTKDVNASVGTVEIYTNVPVDKVHEIVSKRYTTVPVGTVEKEPFYQTHPIATAVAIGVAAISGMVYAIATRDTTLADRLNESVVESRHIRDAETESEREGAGLEQTAASYSPQSEPRAMDLETAQARREPDNNPYAAETVDGVSLTPVRVGDRLFYLAAPQKEGLTVDALVKAYNSGKGDVCQPVGADSMGILSSDGKVYHLQSGNIGNVGKSEVLKDARYIGECRTLVK